MLIDFKFVAAERKPTTLCDRQCVSICLTALASRSTFRTKLFDDFSSTVLTFEVHLPGLSLAGEDSELRKLQIGQKYRM
jgi:hypothetical protein